VNAGKTIGVTLSGGKASSVFGFVSTLWHVSTAWLLPARSLTLTFHSMIAFGLELLLETISVVVPIYVLRESVLVKNCCVSSFLWINHKCDRFNHHPRMSKSIDTTNEATPSMPPHVLRKAA
jgi:hypothetical protein